MDLWDCALGFMDSQILLTAEKLGVFECMAAGPSDVSTIAVATGLPEDSAARLLTALCALGLVKKLPSGQYTNSEEVSKRLIRGRPGYIGAMFHHLKYALYPLWQNFKQSLLERRAQWERAIGEAALNERMYSDPKALGMFMEGMHAITYDAAAEFARLAPELGEIESVIDIGGASGAFVIALAQAFPTIRGTVVDLAPVQPIAQRFFRNYGVSECLSFHAANFWEDHLPHGADVYSLGFILHDWDTAEGSILLKKIADAIRPGGLLIIGEYLLNEDKTGPLWVARSDLNMLIAARGKERTAQEYRDWIGEFGFDLQKIYRTSKGKHFLLAQRNLTFNP